MAHNLTDFDEKYMQLALALAARGRGLVEPNPMVGAIIVRDKTIVGRGWHRRFGGPHAEIEALRQAGPKARGATLYVTLEPCCHTGKTGPCTQALINARIKRVVAAMMDPYHQVRGHGFAALRRAGVKVLVGTGQQQARQLNRPFIKRLATGMPYVIAKWAQTLDGCVADRHNHSRWISSAASRRQVHLLRAGVDGIIVGIGTALADDPLLTARLPRHQKPPRIATRVLIDRKCQLPRTSQLVRTAAVAPVLLLHGKRLKPADLTRRQRLIQAGVEMLAVDADSHGHLNLRSALQQLGHRGMTNVLVEGGPRLMASLLAANLADEIHVYIAPMILGDAQARHAVEGQLLRRLTHTRPGEILAMQQLGSDIHIVFRPPAPSPHES